MSSKKTSNNETSNNTREETMSSNSTISPEEMAEWKALNADPETAKRAAEYMKSCRKRGTRPIPPSQWLRCGICGYIAPESLVNHVNKAHGGTVAYADALGTIPGLITLTAPSVRERCADAGRKGAAAVAANRVTEQPLESEEKAIA